MDKMKTYVVYYYNLLGDLRRAWIEKATDETDAENQLRDEYWDVYKVSKFIKYDQNRNR